MYNKLPLTILLFGCITAKGQFGFDTTHIKFPINVYQLSPQNKHDLDSTLKEIRGRDVLIYGYADYLGKEKDNFILAKKRAESVKEYLLQKKLSTKQIKITEGVGQIKFSGKATPEGSPPDRVVRVFIKKTSSPKSTITKVDTNQPPPRRIKVSEILENGELKPLPLKSPDTSKAKLKNDNSVKPAIKSRFDVLKNYKKNEILRINSIQFIATKHFLTKESEPILLELLETMRNNPNLALSVEGHVCCIKGDGDALDTDTYELKLSENRAKYICWFLVKNGIERSRLEYVGFGKKHPIVVDEKTEEDAQKNRRVELRVLRN
jgi:outer membrane protein OmpA-like peptidoglycan-associated protein